jgi:hypothetical protein
MKTRSAFRFVDQPGTALFVGTSVCEDSCSPVHEKTRACYYGHQAFTTCAVSSWKSEELDERPHAVLLTAARKSLGSS